MKYCLWIVLIIGLFFSCKNHKEKSDVEVNLILHDTSFVNILVDIHLIEAAKHLKYIPNDSSLSNLPNYYNLIFNKHRISEDEFLFTYNYNIQDPKKMQKILSKVISEIELKELELIH